MVESAYPGNERRSDDDSGVSRQLLKLASKRYQDRAPYSFLAAGIYVLVIQTFSTINTNLSEICGKVFSAVVFDVAE